MKKKPLIGTIGIGLLSVVVIGIYFMKLSKDKATPSKTNANLSELVDVDEIVRHPDHFESSTGVVGKAIKVDESKAYFRLGCEDACVVTPVSYRGQMPELGSEIIVCGEIKKGEDRRYILEGRKVISK